MEMKVWTVIGIYPESPDVCVGHVTAKTVEEASHKAFEEAWESGGEDFQLVAILLGKHEDELLIPRPMDRAEYEEWLNKELDDDDDS